ADQTVAAAVQVDRQRYAAIGDAGILGGNQRFHIVQFLKLWFGQQGMALAEADLGQARARSHDDREGARADFEKELAVIAGRDLVELLRSVRHDTGENV